MSKTEIVKTLKNSPTSQERDQAMRTTIDLGAHIEELSDLSTATVERLREAAELSLHQITMASQHSEQAAERQSELQRQALVLNKRQQRALQRQNEQVQQLIKHQRQQQQQVSSLMMGAAAVGAVTASFIICVLIWLAM